MSRLRTCLLVVICAAAFVSLTGFGGCSSSNNSMPPPPTAAPCPQSTTEPVAPSSVTLYPTCSGYSGSLTNPTFSAGGATTALATTSITAPPTSIPAPVPAPAAVTLYETFVPAATFTWSTGPATQITIPTSTAFTFYLTVDDLTTQVNSGSFLASSVNGQSINFSGGGGSFTVTGGHTYLLEYYHT